MKDVRDVENKDDRSTKITENIPVLCDLQLGIISHLSLLGTKHSLYYIILKPSASWCFVEMLNLTTTIAVAA